MSTSNILILIIRYGLVVLFFPASALAKILNFNGSVKQALQIFDSRRLAAAMIVGGIVVEIVMPLGILTGIADRLAALIKAGYCAITALLFKRFWQPGDFWKSGDSEGRELFWEFLKNFSLASGFLLITVGLDGQAWQAFVNDPLASSHPYAASTSRI
jgi:putative oxidoreductase